MKKFNYMNGWIRFLVLVGLFAWIGRSTGRDSAGYLFAVFANTGILFSMLLGGIFIAGLFIILDRIVFFVFHSLLSRRLVLNTSSSMSVFNIFLKQAREFRAMSAEGVYSDEVVDHAREVAIRAAFDGQELDSGRSWLEFLGSISPTIGFIGTLVGLISSFRELGFGGDIMNVLEGLALSMTTSLLGAIISVLFLSTAWLLGCMRQQFDSELDRRIAVAQQKDHLNY